VADAVAHVAPVVVVPAAQGLDGPGRLAVLEALGESLRQGLREGHEARKPPRAGEAVLAGAPIAPK